MSGPAALDEGLDLTKPEDRREWRHRFERAVEENMRSLERGSAYWRGHAQSLAADNLKLRAVLQSILTNGLRANRQAALDALGKEGRTQ